MKRFTIFKLSFLITFSIFISSGFSQWQKTNGIKGGYFHQVAGDESDLLAITNYGSIFHYNNGEWNYKSSGSYFNDIYKLENKWIGYSSNSILQSEDDGATWLEIFKLSDSNFLVNAKVINVNIYALTIDTIFYSDDFGETWNSNEIGSQVISGNDTGIVYSITSFFIKDNFVLAGGFTTFPSSFAAIVYSTDMGQTWQLTNFPDGNFNIFFFEITGNENSYYTATSGGFFKSVNGIDWTEINDGLPFSGVSLSISKIDIYNEELIAIINNNPSGLYSYNGSTWNLIYGESFPVYLTTENDDLIFCANGDVIKYDKNNNLVLTSDIIASTSKPVISSNGSVFSIYRNKLYRTIDGGLNWEIINGQVGVSIAVNGDSIYILSTSGISYSSNMGNEWTTINSNIPSSYVPKLSSIGLSNKILFAGFNGVRPRKHLPPIWEQGGIYLSTDNGNSWSAFNTGLPTEAGVPSPVYTITTEDNIVIIYTSSGRFSLIDNSWVNISNGFPANTYISSIFIYNDDIIFLTNNGLFISYDKGLTKEEFNNGLPTLPYYYMVLFSYNKELYVFSNDNSNSVYQYNGEQWIKENFPLPENLRFISLESFGKIIYAGTYDNGIWKYDPTSTSNNDLLKPLTFSLSQNYPNPFNPSTIINYQVASGGLVQIKVFNALGKEIATLVNETKSTGEYEIEFDASSLPSGVYFYRIITDNFMETRKMILLR